MNIELRIRTYGQYRIVQPVLEGIVHQEEWLDQEEYGRLVDSLKMLVEDAERFLEDNP